jgi:hypothetical protein
VLTISTLTSCCVVHFLAVCHATQSQHSVGMEGVCRTPLQHAVLEAAGRTRPTTHTQQDGFPPLQSRNRPSCISPSSLPHSHPSRMHLPSPATLQYFDDNYPTLKEQRKFETDLFQKTHRANGGSLSPRVCPFHTASQPTLVRDVLVLRGCPHTSCVGAHPPPHPPLRHSLPLHPPHAYPPPILLLLLATTTPPSLPTLIQSCTS